VVLRKYRFRNSAAYDFIDFQGVEDEHRVMGGERTARLRDDVGAFDACFVTGFLDGGHDVVGVLLYRVVDRRVEVAL
jgi:hypothetical protein